MWPRGAGGSASVVGEEKTIEAEAEGWVIDGYRDAPDIAESDPDEPTDEYVAVYLDTSTNCPL